MSVYYPQALMVLTVLWEDYKRGSAANAETYTTTVVPRKLTVKINDYRTADTFSCDLDYRNFPFDPRSMRSIQVSIYIEDMKKLSESEIEPSPQNAVFVGFADEASIELSEDDRAVRFSGRDLTSILIDTRWDGALVDLDNVNLETVIKRVLAKLESTKSLKFKNRTGESLPTLGQIPGGYGETPEPGEDSSLRNKRSSKQNETYWDVIQDLVSRSGLIAYLEIDTLVVTKPNALYDKEDSKQFVYGRNITDLEMKRKIGRYKDINIKLLSLNPRLASPVIEVFIPHDASNAFKSRMKLPDGHIMIEKLKPDGSKEEKPEPAPFISFNIPKAPSKERLIQIGENIFEEMSRQQIEGSLRTREMMVRNKTAVEFDLTKIRIGTPVSIRIDNDDMVGMRDVDDEMHREHYLRMRGYSPEVAKVLAQTMSGFVSPFYTRSVEMSIDGNKGLEIKIDFVNFIELKKELLR